MVKIFHVAVGHLARKAGAELHGRLDPGRFAAGFSVPPFWRIGNRFRATGRGGLAHLSLSAFFIFLFISVREIHRQIFSGGCKASKRRLPRIGQRPGFWRSAGGQNMPSWL